MQISVAALNIEIRLVNFGNGNAKSLYHFTVICKAIYISQLLAHQHVIFNDNIT